MRFDCCLVYFVGQGCIDLILLCLTGFGYFTLVCVFSNSVVCIFCFLTCGLLVLLMYLVCLLCLCFVVFGCLWFTLICGCLFCGFVFLFGGLVFQEF